MNDHKCPGGVLYCCTTHPRWHVIAPLDIGGPWEVYAPYCHVPTWTAPTWAAAFAYATALARVEKVAAIQDGAA